MQKPLLFVFYLLLFAFTYVACNESKQTAVFKEYHIDSLGFSIAVPEDWTLKKRDIHRYALSFYEPKSNDKDSFGENITIWMEPLPIKISDSLYAKTNIGQFKITQPNLVLKEEAPIHGKYARLYPFSFNYSDNITLYKIQGYTCVKDTLAYNLSCTYLESSKEEYESLFLKIVNTFKPH